MRRLIFTIILAISFVTFSNAQDYKTGIGLRGGLESGVTLKHFIGRHSAVEGLLSTRWRGFNFIGLYEIHNKAFGIGNLNWYYGGGGHVGFWSGSDVSWGKNGNTYTVIGVDGIIGLEYNFSEVPINISLDWKPAYNLIGYSGFWGDGGALSVRYVF